MILAAASSAPVKHGLQYYAFTIMLVAVAVLLVLFCIYWALKVWEQRRIIAHYQREEQRAAGAHVLRGFREDFHDGEFKRTGIEIATRDHSLRIGWISGALPTFFFFGMITRFGNVRQIRIWRFAVALATRQKESQ